MLSMAFSVSPSSKYLQTPPPGGGFCFHSQTFPSKHSYFPGISKHQKERLFPWHSMQIIFPLAMLRFDVTSGTEARDQHSSLIDLWVLCYCGNRSNLQHIRCQLPMATTTTREEPTYDSPSALFQAMVYSDHASMGAELLSYDHTANFTNPSSRTLKWMARSIPC
jgi:hypothetical protein